MTLAVHPALLHWLVRKRRRRSSHRVAWTNHARELRESLEQRRLTEGAWRPSAALVDKVFANSCARRYLHFPLSRQPTVSTIYLVETIRLVETRCTPPPTHRTVLQSSQRSRHAPGHCTSCALQMATQLQQRAAENLDTMPRGSLGRWSWLRWLKRQVVVARLCPCSCERKIVARRSRLPRPLHRIPLPVWPRMVWREEAPHKDKTIHARSKPTISRFLTCPRLLAFPAFQ